MKKGYIIHDTLGRVNVTINPRARRFIARWKGQDLFLTAPEGITVDSMLRALDNMAGQLILSRPSGYKIEPGTRLDFPGFSVRFERGTKKGYVSVSHGTLDDGTPCPTILLDPAAPVDDANQIRALATILRRISTHYAHDILIPFARRISKELGVFPAQWSIGRGMKRLGSCGLDRHIILSGLCLFLPEELRRYIVCHELAHLTHFDHSPQFHALCSDYCGGNGDALRQALKSYRWPIPRI